MQISLTMSVGALHAQNTKLLHLLSQCFLGTSQMVLWQDIAVDYMTFKGHEYLIICNTFSKYPFAYKVTAKSAHSLCLHLLELISQYGPPMSLFTDNGPPFASDELAEFLTHHCIAHHTSSPHFPRSNGFIERQVRDYQDCPPYCLAS